MSRTTPRIAVIGAGASGLTAAYQLVRAGAQVVVYEAEGWVGGRTRTDRLDGYSVDTAAQLFGSTYTRFLALVEEIGLGGEVVRTPGRDALWHGGRAHEVVYGSVASMLASGAVPFRTKLRLGTSYVPFLAAHGAALDLHAPERAAEAGLDRESIASWGAREIGRDFVDFLAYPQLATLYGSLPEETSAALYHILARQGVEVTMHTLRGGMGVLCERLAERVREGGGELLVRTRVEAVEARGGIRVRADARDTEFDGAVVAVPAPIARAILPDARPELSAWLDGVRFRPAVTVAFLLDRSRGVRYFGLSYPPGEARTVAAICVEEAKEPSLAPDGRGLLVAFVRPELSASLLESEAREIVHAIVPDLAQTFPDVERSISRARVYRWAHGNPIVYPGYLERLGTFRRGGVEGDSPLVLAGDYLYTPSVEGAVTSGSAAARRLGARLGRV